MARDEEHVLYRMFDAEQRLIYAGRTMNPIGRIGEHQREKAWFDEVVTITLERHTCERDLIVAERKAIHDEGPLYNIRPEQHVPGEKKPRNPATAEAKRRRTAMADRSKAWAFDSIRELGKFGYREEALARRIEHARHVGVSEDDIAWAAENMYLDQRRDSQALVRRRLADTAARTGRTDLLPPELRD